jgi:hypothetical protein
MELKEMRKESRLILLKKKRPNESVTVAFLSVESLTPHNKTVTPGRLVTESLLLTQPVSRLF